MGSPKGASCSSLASRVDEAVEKGVITEEERLAMGSFRGFLRQAAEQTRVGPKASGDERKLLKKLSHPADASRRHPRPERNSRASGKARSLLT